MAKKAKRKLIRGPRSITIHRIGSPWRLKMPRIPGVQGKNGFQPSTQTRGPTGLSRGAKSSGSPVLLTADKIKDFVSSEPTKLKTYTVFGDINSGDTWLATDGKRFVLDASSGSVIYYESGLFFIQPSFGFVADVTTYPLVEAGRRCGFIAKVLEVEMKFFMGLIAGGSGVGFVLVVGTEVLEFVVEHEKDFPVWRHAWEVFWDARKYLKTYAPTLYEKVFWAVLKKFLGDSMDQVGNATTAEIAAFFVGVVLGHLGEHASKGAALAPLFVIGTIFNALWKRFLLSVAPGAMELTKKQYEELANDIIAKLKESDLTITKDDIDKILKELKAHPEEIKAIFRKLADAIPPLQDDSAE
jgi:hypothetical protein